VFHFKKISKNALYSVIQVIIGGLLQFLAYRILLEKIGLEQFGVWTLVTATAALGRMGELGFNHALVKLIAEHAGRGSMIKARQYFQTGCLSIIALTSGLALLFYIPLQFGLEYLLSNDAAFALAILPSALLAICLSGAAYALTALLESRQAFFWTNLLNVLSLGAFLAWIITIPADDPVFLAGTGLVFQSGVLFVLALITVMLKERQFLQGVALSSRALKEMIAFSSTLAGGQLLLVLFDPAFKSVLNYVAGNAAVGFFEIANKATTRVRQLVVSANNVLLPVFSSTTDNEEQSRLFKTANSFSWTLSGSLFFLFAVLTPVISLFILKTFNETFILVHLVVISGWYLNSLNITSYYFLIGIGRLQPVFYSFLALIVAAVSGGIVAGWIVGFPGALFAWCFGMFLSAFIIIRGALRELALSFEFIDSSFLQRIALRLITAVTFLFYWNASPRWPINALQALIPIALFAAAITFEGYFIAKAGLLKSVFSSLNRNVT
jgi:O-antigen/teichoic acid export membrane protein